jgi:Meckel syndrome type 1 protein
MADPARLDELRRQFEENPRRYFAPLANALRRGGDARAAAALARTQLAVYPGHLTGHVILGQALLDLADADGARAAFARAAALDAGNVVALQQLVTLARAAGDAEAAGYWTERLVEADPELAAEIAPPPAAPAFEPLDLQEFAGGDVAADARSDDAFTAAALDPRLAVEAGGAEAFEAFAPADAFAPLDPVVGLDVPPADPLPAPIREALPELLDVDAATAAEADRGTAGGPVAADDGALLPPPAAPFVTETMAALLLAQGHAAQAADVYERLVAQRPDDARLRARLAELRGAPVVPNTAPVDADAAADADERAARAWRAAFAPLPPEAGAAPGAGPPAADEPGAFDDLSFDRFFAGAPEPVAAGAFERWAAGAGPGAGGAAPAPAAGPAAGPPAAARPAPPAAALPAPADDPGEADEDLAQFNAWLRGLAE